MRAALLTAALALCTVGGLALQAATGEAGEVSYEASRQLAYLAVGVTLFLGLSTTSPRLLYKSAPVLYLVGLGLLLAVMLPGVGHAAKGAQRWISMGPLGTFQPSEVAKLLLVIALARLLGDRAPRRPERRVSTTTLLAGFGMLAVMFVPIALQPDLGTALVLVFAAFVMLFVAGANPIYLAGVAAAGLGALPSVLKEYQWNRLLVFVNPDLDPGGLGYNLAQSKTAIGSGGMWGDGLFSGYMSQHGFVPENWTDFVFTVVGEELGFVGCAGVMLLHLVLLGLLLRVAFRAGDLFGTLVAVGVAAVIGFQAVVNMGMTVGLLPVVGIPLPFLSFGGSALLTNFAALGVVAALSRRAP